MHKMTDSQAMTLAISQAATEATKAIVQVMAAAGADESTKPRSKTVNMGPRLGRPSDKQPSFNLIVKDKYAEVRNFRLEVKNIFKTYNTSNAGKVTIIKNWL